ncbi:MAG: hypothetical protein DIJKHBIC_02331 [Thermoanaerobaculia bacterium]|nr:hypothetical protein [Thermoanaerobaculia bacterium]
MKRQNFGFTAVTTEGALLPPDLLKRISETDEGLKGLKPTDYHLVPGERLNETINRSWTRLTGLWAAFKTARAKLPESDPGTSLTRERWLLPILQELGYGRLPAAKAVEIGDKTYSISHRYQHSPLHLVSFRAGLDERQAAITGARKTSPHSLLQEFLNRSDDALWGFVSNGLQLRILRDNASLSRQAFVEFDLETIFEGELYADFALFWMLAHQSRVEAEKPETCWLEIWAQTAREQGTRALERLRSGVEEAIQIFGQGFLKHPANRDLRTALATAKSAEGLANHDYYREILRLVYQLLFLFVAEDRELLVSPSNAALFQTYFSTQRLRDLARTFRGTQHSDLFEAFKLILKGLGGSDGSSALGLPTLGSYLFSEKAVPHLIGSQLSNKDFLAATRSLAFTLDQKVYRPVDYRNLGAEELGSVYEGLLELHPRVNAGAGEFTLGSAAGSERKTTGSYYTPTSLVNCLLDSALDPVLEEAASSKNPEEAILNLKICDPACGSGHFLIAASHRVAKKLASVRTGDLEPPPEAQRSAIRDVIGRCIYGVDLNPMAVELCKVALWIEALEPGKPLSFLDHHIQCGNSLIGATPELILKGIPDDAYETLEGDEKAYCSKLKKQNKAEKMAIGGLFEEHDRAEVEAFRQAILAVEEAQDDTVEGLKKKERAWEFFLKSPEYEKQKLVADAWCAAFVMPKVGVAPSREATPVVTTETLRRFASSNPRPQEGEGARSAGESRLLGAISKSATSFHFFHWHLAFPEVFRFESNGFDVVLGNPPWDSVLLREEEFFAEARPDIAAAGTAAKRKRLIASLEKEDPVLFQLFREEVRRVAGMNALVRSPARFPLCGVGRVNLFALFAEMARLLVSRNGRVGLILPSGIVTDDSTKLFFQAVVQEGQLVSFVDFENREGLFEAVHRSFKFGIITISGGARHDSPADLVFFATRVEHLTEPERRFSLTSSDIALLNPATKTCPIFRTRKDAEITKAIYRRLPVLKASGGQLELRRLLNSADDSPRFVDSPGPGLLPLYEGKYFHHYDHRWVTHDGSSDRDLTESERLDPNHQIQPRHWYPADDVQSRFGTNWRHPWVVAWRDIARSTDERTFIASVVPSLAIPDTAKVLFLPDERIPLIPCLIASFASFAFDFVARQKIGGTHMSAFIVEQLPILQPTTGAQPAPWEPATLLSSWLTPRVLELTYTAWDLKPFAEDLGYSGPPFRWDSDRRFLLRCELDAAFFHLYGTVRDDVNYIMETFPIVKKNDEKAFGEFKTKRVILEIYDEMASCIRDCRPFQSQLGPVSHGVGYRTNA